MLLKPIIQAEQFAALAQAQIGVFASTEWLSIYGDRLQMVGIYSDDQQLIGAFYFLRVKKFGLSFIKLPPYTPHCALSYRHDSKNPATALSFTKEVIQSICAYLAEQKFSICVLAFPAHIQDMQPFFWNGFKVVPNYTYRINLEQNLAQIQRNFDSKNRNAINKALKENVTVQENVLSNEKLYDYFSDTLHKAGANVYEAELKAIFVNFAANDNSFAMHALHEDKIIGTVFCVYDKTTCYYLLAGIDKSFKIQGINNLLVFKCIEKAKSLGCSVFDFEGSMLKGVEKFFRSFGPTMHPYYTVNKANIFLEMALKLKKRATF
jgi:lipid II:glycine glycyltransferase (peptidoglycan interpeptide bridge formation enzyme)